MTMTTLSKSPRPTGVTVLTGTFGVIGIVEAISLIISNFTEQCHACASEWDRGRGFYLLTLFLLITFSAIGTYFGTRIARIGLSIGVAGYIAWTFNAENMFYAHWVFTESLEDKNYVSFWWLVLGVPAISVVTFAAFCWYMFGSRTRNFFGREDTTHA